MKSRFLFLSLAAILFFSSCTKEQLPTDPRDAFEGYYKGTVNVTIPALSYNETEDVDFDIEKHPTVTNQIYVDGDVATVSGNSFTYAQFSVTDNTTAGTIVFIFNGTGTLSGSRLTQSGTVKTVIQGTTYNGTWSSSAVKQ